MILRRVKAISDANMAKFHASVGLRKRQMEKGCEVGIKRAALFLLRESLELVPVDKGTLRASGRARHEGKGFGTAGIVSYGTEYAIYVHEDPDAAHGDAFNKKYAKEIAEFAARKKKGGKVGDSPYSHPRRPQEQYKYLEKPVRENTDTVVKIVRDSVKQAQK
jgi:hypothetical protein